MCITFFCTFFAVTACRSRAVMAKKCTKKHDAHVELLFCQSKPIAFLPFLLMLPLSLLKVPIHVLMGQLNKVHFHFAGSELVDWVMANLSIEDRGSKLTLFVNTFFTKRNEQRHKQGLAKKTTCCKSKE